MDGRYPASTGHRRLESMKNPSPIQSPHSLHHWSNDVPTATRSSLPRSKSDMDISRVLLKVPSSSQLSYNLPHSHSRSEIFSLHPKEGKQGGMKLLISKSSKLLQKRRSSNKSRSFDWQQESDGRSRSSNKHTTFSGLEPRRPFISNPYNFQHLTHTGPAQAKALRTSNRDKLINEFSVIRASQAPKPQLKGIKADDIITIGTHTPSASRSPSPPQSNQDVTSDRNLRSIKSMDSFTRIASNSFSTPHPPISPPPPPRRSSRRQQNRTSQGLGLTKIDTSLVSDIPPSNTIINHSPKSSLAVVEESWISSQEIAQAVTTPDDSAQLIFTHQRTISTPVMLRDVLEERDDDEAVRLEKTEARIRELRRVKELRHAKSFPAQAISPSEFQTPQFGEEDIPARSSRRISADASQTNWEDDIDYCYQHAMEAIGYAWDEEAESSGIDLPTSFPNPYSGSFFMNSGTRNGDSATSSSLSVPGVTTPSDSRPTRDSNSTSHSLLFPLTPSGVSKEFNPRFPTEEQYQHRLMDIDSYSPTEASSRDSGSGISKWSSGESQSTRTGSVVAASSASSKHRSSDSIGSISDTSLYTISKRLTSTSVTSHDLVSSIPPPIPTLASRSRAASESTSKLLDLSMIGAPAPVAGNRTRAGSMASGRGRQSGMTTTTLGRPSYNLFPTVNTVHPLR